MLLGALLHAKTWGNGIARGVVGADVLLVLDNNDKMRGPLERMGGGIYRTSRSYEASL
jgi:hypothetical protein